MPETLSRPARVGEITPIELRIPASSEWVRVARLTVAGVASRQPFGIDAVEDIKLAVTEAINNAIQHAPLPGDELSLVTIALAPQTDGLWIEVADGGRVPGGLPSAPLDGGARALSDDSLPEGGLGLMLIRSLMDEVALESGAHSDTRVRMFKRLPGS